MGLPDIDNIPDSGAVFTIGRSRFADNFASHFFIRQDPVVTIVCGDEHSAVVCESGRLFVFGSNDWGQLGLGHKNHVSKPSCVKVLKPEKVTNVACGRAHTLICTGGQKIFACGSDQEGQLGRGGLAAGDSSSSPVLVYDCGSDDGLKILQVAAGSHHSMALISDGGVIAWGSNLEGQLGLPGITGLVNKPTKVPIPEPVRAISTGYYHTAFLTETGLIYVCGEAESGKLGIVVNFSTQAAPKQLQFPGPAAKIACGGHHSLVLTETGDLYCFGSNVSGQLGMGVDVTEVQTPKLLPRGVTQGEVITKIAAGESHTAIVTESGKLFMCGDGRHGKLGLEENENNVHEMTHAVKYDELTVTDVSCGGCHTILVGKRREDAEEEEQVAVQSDVGQRKNSLPPLKMPAMLGKLAGDVMSEKNELENAIKNVKNDINDTRDHVKEAIANAKNELETKVEGVVTNVTETIEENVNVVKKTAEDMMVGVKDAMNNIKKPEFPKKLADYIEEGNKTEELLNELAADDTEETKNNNTEEILAGSEGLMNRVKSSAASLKSTKSNHSHRSDDGKRKPSVDSLIPTNLEAFGDESQIIPPPKPPRQRSGISDNAVHADKLMTTAMDSVRNAQASRNGSGDSKNPFENSDDEIVQKSIERLASNKDAKGHDIMEINKQENEEKIKDTETGQDDADVQSPPPKTSGKISQLFKGKKSAGGEQNGVKEGGGSASNSKVKSRTCTVL